MESTSSTAATAQSLPSIPPRSSSLTQSCSIAINPISLVINECITITSAMRKNARWAQSGVSAILGTGSPVDSAPDAGEDLSLISRLGLRTKRTRTTQDNPLMAGFSKLRADLAECRDISTFDTPSLFHPFLQVIRSSSITGPITSLALNAITKFFSYRIISLSSPRLHLAMQLLSSAITHCRFEASDSAQDEVVLLRILRLMECMMCGIGGDLLSDESVCEMMETGLSMCCQMRLSEMLRRSAEMSMVTMCQRAFELLKQIEPEANSSTIEAMTSTNSSNIGSVQMGEPATAEPNSTPSLESPNPATPEFTPASVQGPADNSYADVDLKPYGLPSIRELLRVLISLLDPHDRQHTDPMRVMALRIIDVAFEVAGLTIASHASLRSLAVDDLCRHLFQLLRYDSPQILQTSLRVSSTILHTMRPHLKLQQELLLSYMISCLHLRADIPKEPGIDPILYEGVPVTPKVLLRSPSSVTTGSSSGTSTPVPVKERQRLGMEGGQRGPDARETMVECLSGLTRIPSFMIDLFVNYDCDVDRADLCEDLIGLLSRNAFPDAAVWSTPNVPPLCLDALLSYVSFLADRLDMPSTTKPNYPTVVQLMEQRDKKQLIIQGTSKFNDDPKKGIQFLVENGIIDDASNPKSISAFLKNTSRISKKLLGEFLAKPSNKDILDCFIDSFDFKDKRIDKGLRELLESFRLPGESQQIERIVEKFSERYCEFGPKEVSNKDAAFVLSYSMIMLNTDLHNPQVRNRMTLDQYKHNLRKVNNNEDFLPEYLEAIYNAIKMHEIIMPEEHNNQAGFDYAWKELLQKANSSGELLVCEDTSIYDAQMFRATWKPIVATLAYVFTSATDDMVFMRVITGFDHCARIAARYNISDVLDHIILCLSKISTLTLEPSATSSADSTEIQVDGSSITVSDLSVRFGKNYKAQLATVVLFRVVRGNEHLVRSGWREIILIWLNLFANSLISPYFSELQDKLDVPAIPMVTPGYVIKRNDPKDSSIFSTLSSYLSSYAVDGPPEPSDEELESTLCTVDCVNSCNLSEIFDNISALDSAKVQYMLQSLLEEAMLLQQRRPFLSLRNDFNNDTPLNGGQSGRSVTPPPSTLSVNGSVDKQDLPSFAPLSIYVLEMATCLVLKDPECLEKLRPKLMDTFKAILANADNVYPVVVGRVICYMLAILRRVINEYITFPTEQKLVGIKNLVAEIFLSAAAVDNDILKETGPIAATGIVCCFRSCPDDIKINLLDAPEQAFWKALESLLENAEAASIIFEVVEEITGIPDSDGEFQLKNEKDSTKLRLIHNSANFQAVIDLLGAFASSGSVGSEWEQRHDRAGSIRRLGRSSTPPITNLAASANLTRGSSAGPRGVAAGVDRRNYSTLKGSVSGTSNKNAIDESLRGTKVINGKRMTAAEVNAAVAAGTYPGMQRPYADVVERAVKAVKMINAFRSQVTDLITELKLERNDGWTTFWFPILDGLLLQCLNACREVRQQAFGSLQRTLLSPELSATYDDFEWTAIFGTVLFPLVSGLLRPEVYQSDPRGMGETRLQASSLLCKVFLYYLERLSGWDGMLDLWLQILDMMDRLMNSSPRDNLEEAVAESLKNVLLVMSSSGYLVQPEKAEGDDKRLELWDQTWKRLQRFLPPTTLDALPGSLPGTMPAVSASASPAVDLPASEDSDVPATDDSPDQPKVETPDMLNMTTE
ncbi:hypothetical protein POJ06DRAFT_213020 [Lipomyces tetrasporus]|uniref:SEC7 domain-containing protein n=1 Tax=Lipomyces tetrasporus TaxID=54092 RepID=A0AAD7VRD8_9ASCO|nr:uncharacterized protein POJ06DRAFT_213020 [Lipomyces tetrasporus]KAJ8098786.1 hypothetical protein POJ06DRAFT_213020 [Lipomyces tetrasporus]